MVDGKTGVGAVVADAVAGGAGVLEVEACGSVVGGPFGSFGFGSAMVDPEVSRLPLVKASHRLKEKFKLNLGDD